MKALGLVVSDKKIFENCILKTYLLTPWPTYATNQNHLNNFGRGPPRDPSCEVWTKSNEWFQRRRCLSKKVYGRRTTDDDDGQSPVTIAHHEHFVLRWAKNTTRFDLYYSMTDYKNNTYKNINDVTKTYIITMMSYDMSINSEWKFLNQTNPHLLVIWQIVGTKAFRLGQFSLSTWQRFRFTCGRISYWLKQ